MVKDWMSADLTTVDARASLSEAADLMEQNHINFLPVLDNGKLSGMITSADIRPFKSLCISSSVSSNNAVILDRVRVEDVMSTPPVIIPHDFVMEEAADVLLKNKIHGAPVVDENNRVVGVITQTDINRVFISVTGLWRGGYAFGLLLEDAPGTIMQVADTLRSHGARLQSILTYYERAPKGYRKVKIRVRTLDRSSLPELMEKLSQKAKVLYTVDHRDNTREYYSEDPK